MEVVLRFFQSSTKSYFLFGARGTGKSSWIKQYYPDAVIIDLLEPEMYWRYRSNSSLCWITGFWIPA